MLSGLPACGKSTYAKEKMESGGNFVRVNRDLLRTMLHFDKFNYKKEEMTINSEKAIVRAMLSMDKNVIIDDTNLGQRHEDMWKQVALEEGAKFEKKTFDNTLGQCIMFNYGRDKFVPTHRIKEMAMQYKLMPDMDKSIIVVDLDGTVANLEHRLHFIQHENPEANDYDSFFRNVGRDEPIQSTIDLVKQYSEKGHPIVFVSGRSDVSRTDTMDWLDYHVKVDYKALIMRRAGDKRPDTMVKQNFYDKYLKHYDIGAVIDDRPSVIRMWEENGVNVIDVGDGVEF